MSVTSIGAIPLGGAKAWFNWVIAIGFVLVVFILQTGYAITNVSMSEDLGLTIAQVGFIGSIYTWVFALSQLASGSILDRLGAQRVLPFACFAVTAGAFAFANATGPIMLVAAQVLIAMGASFGFIGAGFVGGLWFEPIKYGFMFSLVQLTASLSAVAGQRTISALADRFDWSQIINGIASCGLAVGVLMLCLLRDPTTRSSSWNGFHAFFDDLAGGVNQVAAIRDSWVNALIGGATMGTMLAVGVIWGPRILVAGGMAQTDAFAVTSMSWFGLALGAPAFNWLSDALRRRKLPMALGCALQLLTILVILARPSMSPAEASLWFFLWGFMAGGSMLPFAIGMELVPGSLVGTSAALVNATQFIAGGIMMAIPGRVLSGTGLIARVAGIEGSAIESIANYRWALVVIPLALASVLLLFPFLKETHPKRST